MKRSLVIVALLAVVASACSSGSTPAPAASSSGIAPITISMLAPEYSATTATADFWAALAKKFEAAYPTVKVDITTISWNDITQKITTMVQTKQYPDIVNLNTFASYAADGLIYPADQIVDAKTLADIVPTFANNSKYNGVQYAVPDLASDRQMFYNKDIFTKAGIANPPTTWTELTADCAKIKAAVPADTYCFAVPLGHEEAQAEFTIWTGGNGGTVFANNTWTINSQANIDALKYVKSLVDAGYTQPNPAGTDRTSGAWALFGQGKAAMVDASIATVAWLKDNKSTVNYGVAPFVAADGKKPITLGVQDYFFAFKKPGNQPAVQAFLSFLYQPQNYADFLTAAGGFLPATTSAASTVLQTNPWMKPFIDALPNAIFYPSDQAAWPAVQGALQQTVGTAVQGSDPKQVLDAIQATALAGH